MSPVQKLTQKFGAELRLPSGRLAWVDAVKGVTIILVVLFHVIEGLENRPGFPAWILEYHQYLVPVRMPLFFLIAGLFAQKALRSPLSDFLNSKIFYFLYFYFLWSAINLVIRFSANSVTNNQTELSEFLFILWDPLPAIWFMYALMLAFTLARLLRWLAPPYLVAFAAIMQASAFTYPLPPDLVIVREFAPLFIYFVLGTYASEWIRDQARSVRWLHIGLACLGFAILGRYCSVQNAWNEQWAYFSLSALSAIIIIGSVAKLVDRGRLGMLTFVGRHSLYIYLLHFLPAAGTRIVLSKLFGIDNVYVVIPLAVMSSVVFGVIIYFSLRNTPLQFLIKAPDLLALRLNRKHRRETGLYANGE